MAAVDFLSVHTYPMHDTHYNPAFWGVAPAEMQLTDRQKIDSAMQRAAAYAIKQYEGVKAYVQSLGLSKPIHIGETGWATLASELYGPTGSKATDEYKMAIYYRQMRRWTNKAGISCFYFEAFDEHGKMPPTPGQRKPFWLINLQGEPNMPLATGREGYSTAHPRMPAPYQNLWRYQDSLLKTVTVAGG